MSDKIETGRLAPIVLGANQPERFYRGGEAIADFRGTSPEGDRAPEDWVASTTTLFGEESAGLTRLPDGELLLDAIDRDPVGWLGPQHVERFGSDPRLLVKLLNAGERLPVHGHPGAEFAALRLGRPHGKAEAWYLLSDSEIWLGLARDVSVDELLELIATQDSAGMLGLMHHRRLVAGETVFVPPRTLHAIGAGAFLAEIQEPEDLSILIEWDGFGGSPASAHLGLGFAEAVGALDLSVKTSGQIDALIAEPAAVRCLPPDADRFFRFERLPIQGLTRLDAGYAVLIVSIGMVELSSAGRVPLQLRAGSTVVVPHAAGDLTLGGAGEVLLLRPPSPLLGSRPRRT